MRIGRLRHQVVLQRRSGTTSSMNEPLDTWIDLARVAAGIEPLSGREFIAAQQVQSDLSHRITMRYFAGLTPRDRVSWTDPASGAIRTFDIRAIVDRDERHRVSELMCTERG